MRTSRGATRAITLVGILIALLTAAPASATHLAAPSQGVVTDVTASSARHDWGGVRGREYYFGYLYDAQGREIRRVEMPHSEYTWAGLASCTAYHSNATAFSAGHESPRSDWVQFTTAGPCEAPAPSPDPGPAPSPGDPVIAGAGDIATSGAGDEATAKLLDGMPGLAAVFTTGDNAYPDGTDANYASYYQPTWGRHKAKTRPVPGNHEYHVADAPGYFNYFAGGAGTRAKGWYSYDIGAWHLIALNSSRTGSTCSPVACGPGSEQYEWLKADLAAHPNRCVLAYWHHPLFTRGNYNPGIAGVKPLWDLLYANGADVVLNGHDHNYQRFAPMSPAGQFDTLLGIREFVIGEGGNSEYTVQAPGGNLEASQSGTHGVLRLVLHPASYDWEFVPVAGKTYHDAGTGSCH